MARPLSRSGNGGRRHLWLSAAIALGLLAAAPAAQAAPFAYVTNTSGTVSQYNVGPAGLLAPLSPPMVAAGTDSAGLAVSPNGQSAYVTNFLDNSISQYDIGADGKLSPKAPATVAVGGDDPFGMAVSPDGHSVFVANESSNTVAQYNVGAGGRLSPKSPATVPAGGSPDRVAVSPDGQSVYVTNFLDNRVSQYNVAAGGKLSPKTPATVGTGVTPLGVTVRPDGQSVYVANASTVDVSQYNVGAGGRLSPKTPATVAAVSNPGGVAVSPGGGSLYVTNRAVGHDIHGWISQYSIGGAGRLFPKSPPALATADTDPIAVTVRPDGKSVYVTNNTSSNVSQYNVGGGGALSPKSPATVAAGHAPSQVAVSPGPPGWEGPVTNQASGCAAKVQVPYLDGNLRVTAYTQVFCPRPTRLTIRSRLRSDYSPTDITVAKIGCTGKTSCVIDEPAGTRFFRLTCPKSGTRRHNQRYYSDITIYPGLNNGAATTERSGARSLSPFCTH